MRYTEKHYVELSKWNSKKCSSNPHEKENREMENRTNRK